MAAGAQGFRAGDRIRLRDFELPWQLCRRRSRAAGRDLQPLAAARADAALRRESASDGRALRRLSAIAEQLHGKELSFNNVFDISSAINLMIEFGDYEEAVVAILKHNTPCGVGVGPNAESGVGQGFRDRSGFAVRRDHHQQSAVGSGICARGR